SSAQPLALPSFPTRRSSDLIVMGIIAGWAAITRPVEALCYALPLALFALLTFTRLPSQKKYSTLLSIVFAAAPFIALQMIFNIGVTGDALHTPYQLYLQNDQPQ